MELVINPSEVFQPLSPFSVFYLLRMPGRVGEAKVQAALWRNILPKLCQNGRKVCARDKNE